MAVTKMDKKEYIQIEFDRQWKGVVKDYPLIASIFMTPDIESKKVVKEFLSTTNLDYENMLYTPFLNMGTATQIAAHLSDCINNLKKGLGRSKGNYEEGQAAMDRFSQCWTGKIDKEKVR